MGKHKDKRSRSKSQKKHKDKEKKRSHERKKQQKHSRSRSKSKSREQRQNKFMQRQNRASKWSNGIVNEPQPKNEQPIYEQHKEYVQLANNHIANAITINEGGNNLVQNTLKIHQAELFQQILASNPKLNMASPPVNILQQSPGTDFNQMIQISDSSIINDTTKIKKKIYVPASSTFNYTGLIIGPKGANQKYLEEETGCKILVRGKGSQKEGQPPQPDDNEEQHVLVVGSTIQSVEKATQLIEKIINADEETRVRIRHEQLKLVAQLKQDPNAFHDGNGSSAVDLWLTTPYGAPTGDAYIIEVPNDCVGLVIGKGGETIKMLQTNSAAKKVQVAADSAPNSNFRNVFVEGDREAYEAVKRMIDEIVEQQRRIKMMNSEIGETKVQIRVPNNMIGLVIGKNGETIKGINSKTGAYVYLSKDQDLENEKIMIATGSINQINQAREAINGIVELGQKNLAIKAAQSAGYVAVPLQQMMNPMMMGMMPSVDQNQAMMLQAQMMQMQMQMQMPQEFFNPYAYQNQVVETIITENKSIDNKSGK